jgi:hypothetical protein
MSTPARPGSLGIGRLQVQMTVSLVIQLYISGHDENIPLMNDSTARGPCPGLNTLANHGYLPHNGREITRDILADAMLNGFNIAKSDAIILFSQAVRTNPKPFARTFDLDTLGREGVLEHDFSLR